MAVVVEPATSGHENPHSILTVVEPLEPAAPSVELVQLVKGEHLGDRKTTAQDRVPVLGDVPIQVSRRIREDLTREGGLPDLTRAGNEHHLSFQIASDLVRQITREAGSHAAMLSFSRVCKKTRDLFRFPVKKSVSWRAEAVRTRPPPGSAFECGARTAPREGRHECPRSTRVGRDMPPSMDGNRLPSASNRGTTFSGQAFGQPHRVAARMGLA